MDYKQTDKQSMYCILTWEPSAAKVIKSYSDRLLALERFYRKLNSRYFSLEFLNQANNIIGSPELSNQNLRQMGSRVPELWSNKQAVKQRLQLYIYV